MLIETEVTNPLYKYRKSSAAAIILKQTCSICIWHVSSFLIREIYKLVKLLRLRIDVLTISFVATGLNV